MRYRKPEELKKLGIKWINAIPVDWEEVKFKYVTKLEYGDSLASDDRIKGEIKVFGSNGSVGYHNKANTGAPTIIVGRKGSYGKLNYSEESVFAIDTTYYVDSVGNKDIKWLFYLMSCMDLDSISKDTGVPGLSREDVYIRFVPLPSLHEQHTIAAFLDRKTEAIAALIEKKEQLIERLKEKRQALITRAVTKGLDPDVPMKDSGIEWLGEIPADWGVIPMKYISYMKGRIGWRGLRQDEFVDEGPFLVTGHDIKNGYIDWDKCYHITRGRYDESPEIQLKEGDLIFTKDGTIGKTVFIDYLPGPTSLNSHLLLIRPLKNRFHSKFSKYIYESSYFNYYVQLNKTGSTLHGITQTEMENFKGVFPSLKEQNEIIDYLESETNRIDSIINRESQIISLLTEYRQSLISAAVTGKIDVQDEIEETISTGVFYNLEDITPLVMYFLDEFHRRKIFYGRLMVVKNYFLLHHILKISGLSVSFKRYPKGPHDPDFWEQLEQKLISKRWITVEQDSEKKSHVCYDPNRAVDYKSELKQKFGNKLRIIQKVVNELAQHDSRHAEVLATVYAAWNDLIHFDKEPTEENILYQVLNRWPGEEKKKISKSKWKRGIQRLKALGIEPTGFGKPTTAQIELL